MFHAPAVPVSACRLRFSKKGLLRRKEFDQFFARQPPDLLFRLQYASSGNRRGGRRAPENEAVVSRRGDRIVQDDSGKALAAARESFLFQQVELATGFAGAGVKLDGFRVVQGLVQPADCGQPYLDLAHRTQIAGQARPPGPAAAAALDSSGMFSARHCPHPPSPASRKKR